MFRLLSASAVALCLAVSSLHAADATSMLNVSYDPTREFYQDYNKLFDAYRERQGKPAVKVSQSHGGSGKQARAVIDGLPADVVTLALAYDIDTIAAKTGKISADWQSKLPHNSTPYNSTIVFVVHKGNPKSISDWDGLVKEGVAVITPNPKTSGGARRNYLAAWAYALEKSGGDEAKAKEYVAKLFKNVPVLDAGARASTTTFAQRGIGDVLVTWENEAHLAVKELGVDKYEIVFPSMSILAEPPVALVEGNAKTRGTEEAAQAYLEYLYSKEAQELAVKYYFRPADAEVAKANEARFPKLKMKTIADLGGWEQVQKAHFADGGIFDQIYAKE